MEVDCPAGLPGTTVYNVILPVSKLPPVETLRRETPPSAVTFAFARERLLWPLFVCSPLLATGVSP